MILGSEPKPTNQGPSETCDHVFRGEANEEIHVLHGSEFDVMGMYDNALAHGDKYATCHFKINPKKNISHDEMMQTVSMMALEFGFSVDECTIVKHKKPKAGEPDADEHYHVYAPWRTESGKCINSSFSRVKQEKISRISEYLFGHDIVKGKHQVAVIKQLRDEGKDDIADYIERNTPNLYEPVQSAFTSTQHQMAQRQGINLGQLKNSIKELRISSESFKDMIDGLDTLGVSIKKGDKSDTYIIVNTKNDKFLGSANRLFGMKKQDFKQQYEALQDGQDTKYEPVEAIIPVSVSPQENRHHQKAAHSDSKPSTLIPSSKPSIAPGDVKPGSPGHWLGSAPIILNTEKAVATEGMTQEERQSIHDFNKQEAEKDQQIRELLADQKKFAEMLNQVISAFHQKYQHLPPEPFANSEYRDSHIIQKKIHEQLDPLRNAYLNKKSGWLSSAKKELKAFNDKVKDLQFKDFPGLNIVNNEKDYDYVISNVADLFASSRQKKHDQWSSSIDVINYVNNKKDIDSLVSHIQLHQDADLLLLASKSPALAIQQMKKQQQSNNNVINKNDNAKAIKLKLEI